MFASSLDLSKRSWLDTPVNKEGRLKKQKGTVRLKWPIFHEMAEREPDPFWKDYWIRASKGKFPIGFTFNGKELCYTYRNKPTYVVFNDDVINMCQLSKVMFQDNSNIYSPLDLKRINKIYEIHAKTQVNEKILWNKRKNPQKDSLISHFLIELAKLYHLTEIEKDELHQTINIGIILGAFNENNIIVEDNKIVEIIGLDWSDKDHRFFINDSKAPFKIKKPSKSTSKTVNPYCLYTAWKESNTPRTSNKNKSKEITLDDIDNSISAVYE